MTQQPQERQNKQAHRLLIPLLFGDEEEPWCGDDDEHDQPETTRREQEDTTVATTSTAEDDDDDDEDSVEAYSSRDIVHKVNTIFFWVVMPLFCLFVQFAFAFSFQEQQQHHGSTETSSSTTTMSVSWCLVNLNIGLFAVTVWLYRWALQDSPRIRPTNLLLLLLPEIWTNIVLAILVFGKIVTALVVLILGIQLMSLLALAVTFQALCNSSSSAAATAGSNNKSNVDQEKEEDVNESYFSLEEQVGIRLV